MVKEVLKVTDKELSNVINAHKRSGMWLSDGTPLGDPEAEVKALCRKYNIPPNYGLNTKTGEFQTREGNLFERVVLEEV